MRHREFEPPEALIDAIKCFWYSCEDSGDRQTSFEILPDGYAEIIFHFGNPCTGSYKGVVQPLPSPFLMGLLNHPVRLDTSGRFQVIGIRCYPWTVFDLLGLESGKDGMRVFEHPIAQLQSRLSDSIQADRIEEAIAEVQRYFLQTRPQIAPDIMLTKAGVAMREGNGTMPVIDVATAAHATVRTLERKFKRSSGYTVKDVSSLMRFEQARNQLWLQPGANLAALAHVLGYTDQSHLNREFKRYSGTTPAAFARNAKKRQQAMSGDFVAFIQA
jgi:AraC-like DNA-binding protein